MNAYGIDEERERRERLNEYYCAENGRRPEHWFSSPGRAEIAGNHTDHNLGKALVSAISCDILCAAARREDNLIEIKAESFHPIRFTVQDLGSREREKGKSIALARGVLGYLKKLGCDFGGFSACTQSEIFQGAGVSSSAAFEVLVAEIVNVLYLKGKLPNLEKARAGQYAENVYFGKPCGLLDQSGVAYGGFNLVDFGNVTPLVKRIPSPRGYELVLTNTGGSHSALTGLYAEIKREMGEVAAFFGKRALREVSLEELQENVHRLRRRMSDRAILRAFHFFEENERVERAAEALMAGEEERFLEQVRKSGESSLGYLQNCYIPGEVVQPIVLAMKMSDRLIREGAFRMMGGGYTGTLLAFVRAGQERDYGRAMSRVFGRENVFYAKLRETGACEIEID